MPAAVNPDTLVGVQVDTNCGGGIYAVNVKLPVGFNPLTATDAELAANELPLRPTNPSDLRTWERFVTGKVKKQPSRCGFTAGRADSGNVPSAGVASATTINASPSPSATATFRVTASSRPLRRNQFNSPRRRKLGAELVVAVRSEGDP